MAHVTHEQIKAARIVNLYAFLLSHHPDAVKQEGNSLRLRSNNSVSVNLSKISTEEKHGLSILF